MTIRAQPTSDSISELAMRAVGADDALGAALQSAIDAMQRLAAIRAAHEKGAVTTDGGRVVHASINGREMQRLLYGELANG